MARNGQIPCRLKSVIERTPAETDGGELDPAEVRALQMQGGSSFR